MKTLALVAALAAEPNYAVTDPLSFIEYGVYFVAALAITLWVGRTLFRSGRAFLVDAFHGNAAMADSVNNLLIIGFYLVNFGFMLLFLSTGTPPERGIAVAQHLSWKLGVVVIVLGVMHLINLIVLNGLRNRGLSSTPPPIHKA